MKVETISDTISKTQFMEKNDRCSLPLFNQPLKVFFLSALTLMYLVRVDCQALKVVKGSRGVAPLHQHTTYHVSIANGNDKNSGTSKFSAFKTIQKAADLAQPGDTVLVYAGIYRERVKPARGGTSENNRITYMAKPGDHVVITGLDIWKPTWNNEGNLYFATPGSKMFMDSNYVDGGNPYKIGYMGTDSISLGQVVVDGLEYSEQKSKAAANVETSSWWADQKTGTMSCPEIC